MLLNGKHDWIYDVHHVVDRFSAVNRQIAGWMQCGGSGTDLWGDEAT